VTKMSSEQKRYAMAKAAYQVAQQTEHEIIDELTTADMTDDDATALYIAADEASGLCETLNELGAAEEALVAWARGVVASKHDLTPDLERLMTTDWKRFINIREKIVDLSFRLAA
jgi:hypothetical protein